MHIKWACFRLLNSSMSPFDYDDQFIWYFKIEPHVNEETKGTQTWAWTDVVQILCSLKLRSIPTNSCIPGIMLQLKIIEFIF